MLLVYLNDKNLYRISSFFYKFNTGFGNRFYHWDFMFELQSFFFSSSASPKIFSLPTVLVCLLSAQSAVRFCPAAAAAAVFLSLWPPVHKRRSEAEEREELFRVRGGRSGWNDLSG